MASANTQQQSASPEEQTPDGVDTKEVQECEEYDAPAVGDMVTTVSDEGNEEKDDLKDSEVKQQTCAYFKVSMGCFEPWETAS